MENYGNSMKIHENYGFVVGDLVETYGKIHENAHRSVENPRLYLMFTFGENPI